MNGFGETVVTTLFGESHGPEIGCTVTGLPAGFKIDRKALRAFMARRAPGRDKTSTARREPDEPIFTSGVARGRLTGDTLRLVIANTDTRPGDYLRGPSPRAITVPRPGHADFGAWIRDGRIPTGGGRWSGRLTAPLCAAGGIAKQILAARHVTVTATIESVGGETDPSVFEKTILAAKAAGDSVGGTVRFTVTGLPAGLGDASFAGVEGGFARGLYGIPAVKGVAFGDGFVLAALRGSQANDAFVPGKPGVTVRGEAKRLPVVTRTNRCGGILGGITTGMPVTGTVAFKPTPSIALEQDSVDLATLRPAKIAVKGRHDPCVVPRAVPVVEAVCALAALDLLATDERIRTEAPTGSVFFGSVSDVVPRLRGRYARLALVTDDTVEPLHGAAVTKHLRRTGARVFPFVLPAGEESKNLAHYGRLLEFLAENGFTRTDLVVALGGGVVGDLAGFAAATYLRGIDVVQIPTTLLAAVDASVGGKTAVDLPSGKNLVGAFHFPVFTQIDARFFKTLPPRIFRCGLAEAIKCAVLDATILPLAEKVVGAVRPDAKAVEALVRACVAYKERIVRADPRESGMRRLLNLGHTFGHAVEKLSGYTIPHGEAVAIGLAIIARKCAARGLCTAATARRIVTLLRAAGLPTTTRYAMPDLARAAAGDKKAAGNMLRLVVPRAFGDCVLLPVPRDLADWID